MKVRTRTRRTLVVVIGVCLIIVAGAFIANPIIENRIRREVAKLPPELQLKFASVHANVFLASVRLNSVDVNFIPYKSISQYRHHLYFQEISLKGISFFKFLFKRQLNASNLSLQNGKIELDSFLLARKDSSQSTVFDKIQSPFKKLFFNRLYLNNTKISIGDSQQESAVNNATIILDGVLLSKPGDIPTIDAIEVHLSGISYLSNGYTIRVGQIDLNSQQKKLDIGSIELGSTSANKSEANINSIKITGFEISKLINYNIFDAKDVQIAAKEIKLVRDWQMNPDDLHFALKEITIAHLQSSASVITIKDGYNTCSLAGEVAIERIKLDSAFEIKKPKFESVSANLTDIRYAGNNYLTAQIQSIRFDSKKNRISLKNIDIVPGIDKYDYQKKLGHQADWLKASISGIEIERPDFNQLLMSKVFAEQIIVGPSQIYIFRDRRLERQQKAIPLPVDFLKSLPIDIRIRNCQLATSNIEYEEYPKSGYDLTGILKIENARASISSIINRPLPGDPSNITMRIEGSIMGSGTTHGTILMPLQKDQPYKMTGQFDRVDLTKLNSSSENLGKIRIKSGFLDFLYFDFSMTDQRSTGKIIGAYHNLIIQPLKKNTEKKNIADLASFALRHGIIPLNKDSSLPEKKRTGFVDYRRDATRMVSYYYLQSLLMGIKKSFKLGFLLPK